MKIDLLHTLDELMTLGRNHPAIEGILGLGSTANLERMDDFSDLDFFLIVAASDKQTYLKDLTWLDRLGVVYTFRNTIDGYKALTNTGVFMEFAIFTLDELRQIPYQNARIIYAKNEMIMKKIPLKDMPYNDGQPRLAFLHEALTNLYVGLLREKRGEKFAALQMIQQYALENVIRYFRKHAVNVDIDPFNVSRRIHLHDAELNTWIQSILQGINGNRIAASLILEKIKKEMDHHNPLLKEIENLL